MVRIPYPAVDPAWAITPSGVTTKFSVMSNSSRRDCGRRGWQFFWFVRHARKGRPNHAIGNSHTIPSSPSGTIGTDITAGADDNFWVVDQDNNAIFRVTTAGVVTQFTFPSQGGANQFATGITTGPDGNLWVAALGAPAIWRVTPPAASNQLLSAVLPSSRSVQVGSFATAFATILNNNVLRATTGCAIVPITSVPASFTYPDDGPEYELNLPGRPTHRPPSRLGLAGSDLS